ncbi:MAG: hypothetical protein QOK17_2677 [Sphingomonadales bacterium]|jgi:hypothetical protein|nr:hypothetical protein [Sphingomonadales bacterium]
MRLSHLLLAPLAAPLFFISPAAAFDFAPPCCQRAGETHSPDPHRQEGQFLTPAEVRRLAERALEASAEAPVERETPLLNAIGIPLDFFGDERRGVSEPEIVEPSASRTDPNGPRAPADLISTPPCCQVPGELHDPDPRNSEDTPVPIGARVKSREDRALEAAVELPIPAQEPRVEAIGLPLDAERGVSEPTHRTVEVGDHHIDLPGCCTTRREDRPPVTVDAPWASLRNLKADAEVGVPVILLLLAAIGFWFAIRRRRPRLELEPLPVTRPMPDELPLPDMAPVPIAEPEVVLARARQEEHELEPA